MYLDSNNNEDLTDDWGPRYLNIEDGYRNVGLKLEVPILTNKGQIKRQYSVWMHYSKDGNQVSFSTRGYYHGNVDIGGVSVPVVAYDLESCNALYDGASIWLDLDGDTIFDEADEGYRHDSEFAFRGKSYRLVLENL